MNPTEKILRHIDNLSKAIIRQDLGYISDVKFNEFGIV